MIPAAEDVELVLFSPRRTLYEALAAQLGGAFVGSADPLESALVQRLLGGAGRDVAAALSGPARLFRRGEPLALMPGVIVE